MSLESFYKEAMALNTMKDMEQRKNAAKAFFEKLNKTPMPENFNWAAEIFEGLHVKERGDQKALIWTDLDTDAERQFTYKELAANGNKFLNFIRKKGVEKGCNLYMLSPIVPETWFASFAALKGGLVAVPTATTMTEREIQFRFEAYKPDVIVCFDKLTGLVDDALKKANCTPKAKIILGQKEGWISYTDIDKESDKADAAQVKSTDVLFCFFTSGTTGLPKRGCRCNSICGTISTSIMRN
ncbi:MAG: AMP-binding protein [Desulfobacterales bacterium]